MANKAYITIDKVGFTEAVRMFKNMHESLDERWMKNTQARRLRPIANEMKRETRSRRLMRVIGVTTSRKKAPRMGAKVGVIKNNVSLFPKFSSYATASVIERGTDERFRHTRAGSFITGRISTGKMPADPFIFKTWNRNKRQFFRDMADSIERKIEKEARR